MDITTIQINSLFDQEVTKAIKDYNPKIIVETGTYLGQGTTKIIASAKSKNSIFYTIECNIDNYKKATEYGKVNNLDASYMYGLSIPRFMLPSIQEIDGLMYFCKANSIPVDFRDASGYYQETQNINCNDNLLHVIWQTHKYIDCLLLDSAGHIGFLEFLHILNKLDNNCLIILDDIYHVKHYRTLQYIKNDTRFKIKQENKEKYGFCIAEFTI